MKKKTKIIISAVFMIILVISIILNIVLGIKSGMINETKSLSGSVNESWCKNDAYIVHATVDNGKYYSNYDGDYITKIDMEYRYGNTYEISYEQDFNTFNDLEVYFVIEASDGTRFNTGIEKSETPIGTDSIFFDTTYSIPNIHIAEVWVRTID